MSQSNQQSYIKYALGFDSILEELLELSNFTIVPNNPYLFKDLTITRFFISADSYENLVSVEIKDGCSLYITSIPVTAKILVYDFEVGVTLKNNHFALLKFYNKAIQPTLHCLVEHGFINEFGEDLTVDYNKEKIIKPKQVTKQTKTSRFKRILKV